jgi:hypothetical protein
MTTIPGDRIHKPGFGTFTVVALCENPNRAWVISHYSYGLVNGPGANPAFVVNLREFRRAAEKGPRSGKEESPDG